MAVDLYALTSLANIKEYLLLDEEDISRDALLENLINRISDLIEEYCSRLFKNREYTEYHDGRGLDFIQLDQFPIISITSLHDDVDRNFTEPIVSDDYIIYANEGKVRLLSTVFTKGKQNVKAIYEAGYANIPDDLEHVCLEEIAWNFYEADRKRLGVSSESSMGIGLTFLIGDLLPSTKSALQSYRKIHS